MAKSKSRSRDRSKKVHEAAMVRLERKVAGGPPPPAGIVREPEGQVKMSDVLEQFVEPYLRFPRTAEEHRKLLTLATLAWNAALLPPGDCEKMITEVLHAGLPAAAEQVRAEAKDIVDMLVLRKRLLFADNSRRIINFDFTETADGFHLAVASTL